jgi:hypothetical protein
MNEITKPAPDAVREAVQLAINIIHGSLHIATRERNYANVDKYQSYIKTLETALAAPVPSPEGAGEPVAHRYHPSAEHMGDCSVCGNIREHSLHAAPPVMGDREALIRELCGDELNGGLIRDVCFTVWKICHEPKHPDGNSDWGSDTLPTVQKVVEIVRSKLASLPGQPGAGEREAAILECANIAKVGAKQCDDGDTNWHQGFRYAANATALEIESTIRSPLPPTSPIH